MAEKTTIARPYARAAFELAQEQQRLAAWSEKLAIAGVIAADATMRDVLASPRVNRRRLAQLFVELCGAGLEDGWPRFLELLAENQRLGLLPEIARLYDQLRAEAERSIEVSVVSAVELSEEDRKRLARALKAHLKRDVSMKCEADKALLGGIVVRAGDLVIDGSVRGKLAQLAEALRH